MPDMRLELGLMRRYVKIGGVVGFVLGSIVFLGYAVASWWVCTSLRDCPGHWLPYLIIFGIGVVAFTVIGIVGAAVLRKLYEWTRVESPTS